MEKFDKLAIADELLESAIQSYLDDEKYFSALHLAGAAQEIYGKWLRIKGGQDLSTMILDKAAKVFHEPIDKKAIKKEDKRPKNSIKHMDSEADRYTYLRIKFDTFCVICEAVAEHKLLKRNETANIVRFKKYLISTRTNGL
ncbi:hypothetical protein [Marinomonas lutimaris]|uniref:hypothetical protein n=1 Tax=Marinomonas lutimaris TaxID=2846746 RepID=UPI001CA5F32F|nr:hypothetical protein [Marinomonas lutimaris]